MKMHQKDYIEMRPEARIDVNQYQLVKLDVAQDVGKYR